MSSHGLPLVLASASPRRRELLSLLGLELMVLPATIDECPHHGEPPPSHALRVAREKAAAVATARQNRPVLAADTIVVLGGEILGKPRDRSDAERMLRLLSGRTHVVLTALTVLWQDRVAEHVEHASVTFSPISSTLLEWYLATGEGDDKAGAYAVQGRAAAFIERVEGNVQAVIGLPLAPLPRLFANVGLELRPGGSRLTLVRTDQSRL